MPEATLPASDFRKGTRMATLLAAGSALLALLSGLAQVMGGVGYRLHWWGVGGGIQTVGIATLAAVAAGVIALAALLMAYLAGARGRMGIAAIGLVLATVIAAPPLLLYRQAGRLPSIHDISTDTDNPPRFAAIVPLRQGAPNSLEYSADEAAKQKAGYPDIAPAVLDVPPARAFDLADQAARAMGWDIVSVSPPDLRIEATATTLLFGFKDDVVVRITPAPNGSRVDVRSVSRVGQSDVGTNARRIRAFMKKLDDLNHGGTGSA